MNNFVYVSKSRVELKRGPLRIAYFPGEKEPAKFSVHRAIASVVAFGRHFGRSVPNPKTTVP